jgi:hypothetical protein
MDKKVGEFLGDETVENEWDKNKIYSKLVIIRNEGGLWKG